MCVWSVALCRLQEEVELMEDEMRRREEGGGDVLTDSEMENELWVALMHIQLCIYSIQHYNVQC